MVDKKYIIAFLKQNKDYIMQKYNIRLIALYGSFAIDEATEKSDIDIVYDKQDYITYKKYIEAEEYLEKSLKSKIDLVNINYMNPIIKINAEKEFIYV